MRRGRARPFARRFPDVSAFLLVSRCVGAGGLLRASRRSLRLALYIPLDAQDPPIGGGLWIPGASAVAISARHGRRLHRVVLVGLTHAHQLQPITGAAADGWRSGGPLQDDSERKRLLEGIEVRAGRRAEGDSRDFGRFFAYLLQHGCLPKGTGVRPQRGRDTEDAGHCELFRLGAAAGRPSRALAQSMHLSQEPVTSPTGGVVLCVR